MIDAILLDGSPNPTCLRLSDADAMLYRGGSKKSMSWSGSAEAWRKDSETPPKYFNFLKIIKRDEPPLKEVLVFLMVGVRNDQLVPGLRMKDLDLDAEDAPVTIEVQGQLLAEQFLYPEKYALMGRIDVAA